MFHKTVLSQINLWTDNWINVIEYKSFHNFNHFTHLLSSDISLLLSTLHLLPLLCLNTTFEYFHYSGNLQLDILRLNNVVRERKIYRHTLLTPLGVCHQDKSLC